MESTSDISTLQGFIYVVVLLVVYMLPAFIAGGRGHHQSYAILWVNLLLGWTVVGWLAAFIWSVTAVNRELTGDRVKCPHCAELILREANICKSCGRDIARPQPVNRPAPTPSQPKAVSSSKAAQAAAFGIEKKGAHWMFDGKPYPTVDIALKYAEAKERAGAAT